MIQRAVIMAAGKGTRMKSLTADRPKHLLPVNGRPFITYLFDRLLEAGLREFVLVIGYHAPVFRQWLATVDYPVTVVEQSMGPNDSQGTAVAVQVTRAATKGEPFLVVSGDNLYSVRDLKKFRRDDGFHYVGGLRSDHPERFGVLLTEADGTLTRIVEKPLEFVGDTINASVYTFQPDIYAAIERVGRSARGEYELTDAVTILAKQRTVRVIALEDFWTDFGRPEDIPRLEQVLKQERG